MPYKEQTPNHCIDCIPRDSDQASIPLAALNSVLARAGSDLEMALRRTYCTGGARGGGAAETPRRQSSKKGTGNLAGNYFFETENVFFLFFPSSSQRSRIDLPVRYADLDDPAGAPDADPATRVGDVSTSGL